VVVSEIVKRLEKRFTVEGLNFKRSHNHNQFYILEEVNLQNLMYIMNIDSELITIEAKNDKLMITIADSL
jgi:hypothetical protein